MYRRILVALDGSSLGEQVLPHAEALAERFGARLLLVRAAWAAEEAMRVGAPDPTDAGAAPPGEDVAESAPLAEPDLAEATNYLRRVAFRLQQRGIAVEYGTVQGAPADAILERARALSADLIAMTTHGRSGLQRLFYGSAAEAVLRRAPCPVLLVRTSQASSE